MANEYSIINVVKDVLTGELKTATAELAQQRLDICAGCEAQNKALKVCTACGCFLPLKVKLEESSCPMELW